MNIVNHTTLATERLVGMFLRAAGQWSPLALNVVVRYARSAIYSGTFAAHPDRIYINLGRNNRYPLQIDTAIARAHSARGCWWKPTYHVVAENEYQLALFIFLHELYHYLIHRAQRNPRKKEAMCDRFAVRYLVDHCRLEVFDSAKRPVARDEWLFQNLDRFVATPQVASRTIRAARRPMVSTTNEFSTDSNRPQR
jgi:hypothetical protein